MRIVLISATVACVSYGLKWTSSSKLVAVARPIGDATALKLAHDRDFMKSVEDMQEAAAPHRQEIVELMGDALRNVSEGKAVHANSMLTEIGSKMKKSSDVLSADAWYIGLELRCENPKMPMTPGWEFEFFVASKTDGGDVAVCFALQGGLDYELSEKWGMKGSGEQEKELMLMMGGTKFDQLPLKKLKPILEYGGQATVKDIAMDATVDVDLKTGKTMMVGDELEIGAMVAKLADTEFGKSLQFLKKLNAKHGPIEAEINGGGMICVE